MRYINVMSNVCVEEEGKREAGRSEGRKGEREGGGRKGERKGERERERTSFGITNCFDGVFSSNNDICIITTIITFTFTTYTSHDSIENDLSFIYTNTLSLSSSLYPRFQIGFVIMPHNTRVLVAV